MVGTGDDEGDLGEVFVAPGNDGELAGLLKILPLILCRTMQSQAERKQRRS